MCRRGHTRRKQGWCWPRTNLDVNEQRLYWDVFKRIDFICMCAGLTRCNATAQSLHSEGCEREGSAAGCAGASAVAICRMASRCCSSLARSSLPGGEAATSDDGDGDDEDEDGEAIPGEAATARLAGAAAAPPAAPAAAAPGGRALAVDLCTIAATTLPIAAVCAAVCIGCLTFCFL